MEYMAFLSRNLELLILREKELIELEKEQKRHIYVESNLQ
jgi:hypothetical protein